PSAADGKPEPTGASCVAPVRETGRMMIHPDQGSGAAEISWQRDTCPRCGSDQVIHHVIGMPVAGVMESSPPWVVWEGCVGLGPERECRACEHAWSPEEV